MKLLLPCNHPRIIIVDPHYFVCKSCGAEQRWKNFGRYLTHGEVFTKFKTSLKMPKSNMAARIFSLQGKDVPLKDNL